MAKSRWSLEPGLSNCSVWHFIHGRRLGSVAAGWEAALVRRLGSANYYRLGESSNAHNVPHSWTHGEVPLDNKGCEIAIRPFIVCRKGRLFSDTVKGAVASANLYSFVETARANNVEPHAYPSLLFERLPCAKTVEDFEALLP
jgi:IS66 C-terminal element/Transposase IS66 family